MKHHPFETLWLKRRAQFSTVAFVRSSDPKRLPQFINFIYSKYSSFNKPFRVYVYKVWSGLFEINYSEDEYTLIPVATSGDDLLGIGGGRIRRLENALQYLDNIMETGERIVVIFWGIFSYKTVSDVDLYSMVQFLRSVIFEERYYPKYHLVVVFTETPELVVDDDTLKHSILVEIEPSTEEERLKILEEIANTLELEYNKKDLIELARLMRGLNLHETESIALESLYRYREYRQEQMLEYKYDIIRKSGIIDVEKTKHGFEAVGGYDMLKQFIRDNIIKVLKNQERARRLGIEPPRGLLLFGPPGTGKTWLAKAMAKELGIPFLRFRTEKIVSKWYGETSRNIAKAIQVAEAVAPAVVFIDEIDRFGRRGHLSEHEESRRAFSILLEWLGDPDRKSIILGTTNRPEDLDEAFIRVGRFDYILPMLYPDYKARLEILKIHTSVVRRMPLAEDVDLKRIAEMTELWSGSELEELVRRAGRKALQKDMDVVSMKEFLDALRSFRVDMDARRKTMQKYLQLAQKFVNDEEFLRMAQQKKTRVEALMG